MINVNLIRAFTGPRHSALEDIWATFARAHKGELRVNIFDNVKGRVPHDVALTVMWGAERRRPEPYAIFTEFDFLPYPSLAQWPVGWDPAHPVQAAEYVTRDPATRALLHHGIPGAWFIRVVKPLVKAPNFWAGGQFNDPGNLLEGVKLLPQEDCLPRHFGTRTRGAGEHTFWSRHFNDPPETVVAGFPLGPILDGVDRAIKEWTDD